MYDNCMLCPRECGVNRSKGELGYCGVSEKITVSRAAPHFWEEPCISGESGSGTVFFTGCSLRCVYCQNREISSGKIGKEIPYERLVEIFFELKEKGVLNINLITASQFAPTVAQAIECAKRCKIGIPFIYNTSGYEKVETLKMFEGLIDIYIPDFKYISPSLAEKYSFAVDYIDIVKKSIDEMVRQVGKPVFFKNGIMEKGVIVRHLVLPGYYEESKKIIEYLYRKYKDDIYISIMSQFTPFKLENYPEINKHIDFNKYNEIVDFAIDLGITNAFIQEREADSESFIPNFNCEGV